MSTYPTSESILYLVHQCIGGGTSFQTKKKEKFINGEMSLDSFSEMGTKVLEDILDGLELNPRRKLKFINRMQSVGDNYQSLELKTWTYNASKQQVVWVLLNHFFIPQLAREMALLNLTDPFDKGMPGGKFWYLPEIANKNNKTDLYLPIAQVIDWLLDLLGVTIEELADEVDPEKDSLRRSLYGWRKGEKISLDSIEKYFSDNSNMLFKGAFSVQKNLTLNEQFEDTLKFLNKKNLNSELLKYEIPITQNEKLDALLKGDATELEKKHFIKCIKIRYSKPSMKAIRYRLKFARTIQNMYERCVKFLTPEIDKLDISKEKNKVLQLVDIYKIIYNLTMDSYDSASKTDERNCWFENHLSDWDRAGLFLSVTSLNGFFPGNILGERLTRIFENYKEDDDLEDFINIADSVKGAEIIKRSCLLSASFRQDYLQYQQVLTELPKGYSPWRMLQKIDSYWVINELVYEYAYGTKIRDILIERMKEVAKNPSQMICVTLQELAGYLMGERKGLPKDVSERVQKLLDEAKSSPSYQLWEAPILQFEAKHLLACNDKKTAIKKMREALSACESRGYGGLKGEVAKDLFALEISDQNLIENNLQKCFRIMFKEGMFGAATLVPNIEEKARDINEYYWNELYKPYPGIKFDKPISHVKTQQFLKELLPLLKYGKRAEWLAWMDKNRKELEKVLPDVEGNSLLMVFIKLNNKIPFFCDNDFLADLITKAPKQLNIQDLKKQTPLMLMAEKGEIEFVQLLLESGANPNFQDFNGVTALHSAIKSYVDSSVELLLLSGADVTLKTYDGQTTLHTAAWSGNLYVVKRILGIEPKLAWCRNDYGMTPLECVEHLLNNHASLNSLNAELIRQNRSQINENVLQEIVFELEKAPVV